VAPKIQVRLLITISWKRTVPRTQGMIPGSEKPTAGRKNRVPRYSTRKPYLIYPDVNILASTERTNCPTTRRTVINAHTIAPRTHHLDHRVSTFLVNLFNRTRMLDASASPLLRALSGHSNFRLGGKHYSLAYRAGPISSVLVGGMCPAFRSY
jgi:hypothetical protein